MLFTKPEQADHVIVSISGGKDSSILMLHAEKMKKEMPSATFHYVHSVIDIDWEETLDVVKAQCRHFGVKLDTVQAIDRKGDKLGFLDILVRKKKLRKTGELVDNMFPSMSARWCTSSLKTGPIDKFARKLRGNVLVMIGERWEEGEGNSSGRSDLVSWRPDKNNTLKNGTRNVVKHSPILAMRETEVWSLIEANNIPVHPCYSWGVSRASCAICVFSSVKDIVIAAQRAPRIVKKYIDAEAKIETAFKYVAATKTKEAQRISILDILKEQKVPNLLEMIKGHEELAA